MLTSFDSFFGHWEEKIKAEGHADGLIQGKYSGREEGKKEGEKTGRGLPKFLSSDQAQGNVLFRVLKVLEEVPCIDDGKKTGVKRVLAILVDQQKQELFYSFRVKEDFSLEIGKVLKVVVTNTDLGFHFLNLCTFEEFKPEKEFNLP